MGLGSIDQDTEHAAALGEMPDLLAHLLVDALVDEFDQFVVVAAHAHRSVTGVDQFDGGVHDRAESLVEFESGSDHQHRVEQAVQPVATFDNLLDTVLDLHEQFTQA